ncbi:hypothetical protein COCVIDRAFT_85302, partial [Bipolaris victoriae FI3]
ASRPTHWEGANDELDRISLRLAQTQPRAHIFSALVVPLGSSYNDPNSSIGASTIQSTL